MAPAALWPQQEAQRLVQRWPDKATYVLETGYGPSGHPHMGTVGEVVRTYYVAMALRELGKETEIKVFSDDMDGLRKIPGNVDAPWLAEHLGKPVSSIPDPWGCHGSWAQHMNAELNDMLAPLGLPYTFVSSTDMYKGGYFDEVLRLMFRHMEEIKALMLPTMRAENRAGWFPFQPACENCGRVNTTVVQDYDLETTVMQYTCTGEFRGVRGCGHAGTRSALAGGGKLGWKPDWAARWYALGVNYEMHGKDLIDSADLSAKIVRILGGKPPVTMFYELFLTEEGRKISKSTGQGLTLETWDRYGTQTALNLLMFKNPRQQKKLGVDTVVQYMDETIIMSKDDPQYPYVYFSGDRPDVTIRYSDLIGLAEAMGITDVDLLRPYLERTYGEAAVGENWSYLREILGKALNYVEDFVERVRPVLTPREWEIIDRWLALVADGGPPEAIQAGTFTLAREAGLEQKAMFKLLYGVLLGQESGPRIGGLVTLVGKDRISEIVAAVRQEQAG